MIEKTFAVLINDVRHVADALAVARTLPADLHKLCDMAAGFAETPPGIVRVTDREATVTVNGTTARLIAALVGNGVAGVKATLVIEPSVEMESDILARREWVARALHDALGLGEWGGFTDVQKQKYFYAADMAIKAMSRGRKEGE